MAANEPDATENEGFTCSKACSCDNNWDYIKKLVAIISTVIANSHNPFSLKQKNE